jgi:hypothetical protein
MKNKITLIGCPKLDEDSYAEKLTEILKQNSIKSVTIVRMEVPCCGGLENAAKSALANFLAETVHLQGRFRSEKEGISENLFPVAQVLLFFEERFLVASLLEVTAVAPFWHFDPREKSIFAHVMVA